MILKSLRMGWFDCLVIGLGVGLAVGGAVSYLTVFRRVGLMDLHWVVCWTCCGWGSFIFNSLQVGWSDGLVMGWIDGLVVGGAVSYLTVFKWIGVMVW